MHRKKNRTNFKIVLSVLSARCTKFINICFINTLIKMLPSITKILFLYLLQIVNLKAIYLCQVYYICYYKYLLGSVDTLQNESIKGKDSTVGSGLHSNREKFIQVSSTYVLVLKTPSKNRTSFHIKFM